MKRFLLSILVLLSGLAAMAEGSRVYSIDIDVALQHDGRAMITEVWDIESHTGTEWYLVRKNLGDIRIVDFSVVGDGMQFDNVGEWDVDWSRERKRGRCGIVSSRGGAELCWGIGEYGRHTFEVRYTMTGAVKSLDDYDMLHLQLVSPGLSAAPEKVRVSISSETGFTDDNCRIWGFGFVGQSSFAGGKILFESTESFRRESSVIALVRFDKGIFESASVLDRAFEDVLDRAMEGADFGEEDDIPAWVGLLLVFGFIGMGVGLVFCIAIYNQKRVLGCRMKEVGWARDVPFGGDILSSNYTLTQIGSLQSDNVAASQILRMIDLGILVVSKDSRDRVEIAFNEMADLSVLDKSEKMLHDMMKKASGRDLILQKGEFSRWSSRHASEVNKWSMAVAAEGERKVRARHYLNGMRFTHEGQQEARKLVGLKKYLKDFTMLHERHTGEVALWKDYLVFASLFGIADKVAKELRDINPQAFDEVMPFDYYTMHNVLNMSRTLARSITNAKASAGAAAGHGGATSFGGGGGFSGGGFGGGAR